MLKTIKIKMKKLFIKNNLELEKSRKILKLIKELEKDNSKIKTIAEDILKQIENIKKRNS